MSIHLLARGLLPVPTGGGGGGGLQFAYAMSDGTGPGGSSSRSLSLSSFTGDFTTLSQNDIVFFVIATSATVNLAFTEDSSTWTSGGELYENDSNDLNTALYYKVMGATPDTSVAVTFTTSTQQAQVLTAVAVRGANTTTPLDVTLVTASSPNSGLADPGAITPVTSGAYVLTFACGAYDSTTRAFDGPSNMTTICNNNRVQSTRSAYCIASQAAWTSGAFDPNAVTINTGSDTAFDSWGAYTIAVRPA